jgi:hypothetical protein
VSVFDVLATVLFVFILREIIFMILEKYTK